MSRRQSLRRGTIRSYAGERPITPADEGGFVSVVDPSGHRLAEYIRPIDGDGKDIIVIANSTGPTTVALAYDVEGILEYGCKTCRDQGASVFWFHLSQLDLSQHLAMSAAEARASNTPKHRTVVAHDGPIA